MMEQINESTTKDVFVRWHIDAVRSGLTAKLGPQRFLTLMTIAARMNKFAECWPSQETLSKELGWCIQNTNKWVNSLLQFRWDGKPLITRKMIYKGYKPYSVYTIHPISQLAIYDTQVENIRFIQKNKNEEPGTTTSLNSELGTSSNSDVKEPEHRVSRNRTSSNDEVVATKDSSMITESKNGDQLQERRVNIGMGNSSISDVATSSNSGVGASSYSECNYTPSNNNPKNNNSYNKNIAFGEAMPPHRVPSLIVDSKENSFRNPKEPSATGGTSSNSEVVKQSKLETTAAEHSAIKYALDKYFKLNGKPLKMDESERKAIIESAGNYPEYIEEIIDDVIHFVAPPLDSSTLYSSFLRVRDADVRWNIANSKNTVTQRPSSSFKRMSERVLEDNDEDVVPIDESDEGDLPF